MCVHGGSGCVPYSHLVLLNAKLDDCQSHCPLLLPPLMQLYRLFQETQIQILRKEWSPTTAFPEACSLVRRGGDLAAILAPLLQ